MNGLAQLVQRLVRLGFGATDRPLRRVHGISQQATALLNAVSVAAFLEVDPL